MPENKVPAPTTRPRLLSDILEIPLSESAIPEQYTMRRSSASHAQQIPSSGHEGQTSLHQSHFGSYDQLYNVNDPAMASAPHPGIIGQPIQQTSSGNQSSVARLQPLPAINPQFSPRYQEHRRSTPNLLPVPTTSPAVSEAGSPSKPQFSSLERSISQTSLSARRYPSRPRTPTPSHNGSKGKGRYLPRSSSLPSSPKSRRATPHPYGKPSVKHLTCFWWKVKGDCRFSEEDCLYAHRETGLLADAPRQVTPGGKQNCPLCTRMLIANLLVQSQRKQAATLKKRSKTSVPDALLHLRHSPPLRV
jgi:hypothetical protein